MSDSVILLVKATALLVLAMGITVSLRRAPAGHRLHVRPDYDEAIVPDLRSHFEKYSTVAFENYPVSGIQDDPVQT